MSRIYVEGEKYNGINFKEKVLEKGEYDNCSFSNCHFSGTDLSDIIFSDCEFRDCDFSMANLANASFRNVSFKNCKLLGLRFDLCNKLLLSFRFEGCVLDFSSFYKLKLKNTLFKECQLHEVEFIETDLTNVRFDQCNLARASFENTQLEGSDFRTAYNFSIDPEINQLKKARFSQAGVAGLLTKYNIIIDKVNCLS